MRKLLGKFKRKLGSLFLGSAERRHSLVGNPRLWKLKREFQIGFLRENGLETDDFLLDLGCGTLRGGMPIIEFLQPGHYFGVDVRPEVLEEARRELAEAGMEGRQPTLLLNEDTERLPRDRFDVIWAFSASSRVCSCVAPWAMGGRPL